MKRVFLIGYPVSHSLSPSLQNSAFSALGIDATFGLLETRPDALASALERIREPECIGANVTIPHKQAILRHLDELKPGARRVGAVNTIINREGKLIGANTDVEGIVLSLQERQSKIQGEQVVVLGAGGAARAAVHALAELRAGRITIVNRTEKNANALRELLSECYPNIEVAVNDQNAIANARLVVNATSVGMTPRSNETPLPTRCRFARGAIAFDMVYTPRETRFLQDARLAGAETIDGLNMLVHQGRASFRLWTGMDAPNARSLYAAVLDSGRVSRS